MFSNSRRTIAAALLCLGLAGCTVSQPNLSANFGAALSDNLAAQIADPDANYANRAPPPGDGARANLATTRYREGKVIRPAASASDVGRAAVGAESGSGAGAGAAAQ